MSFKMSIYARSGRLGQTRAGTDRREKQDDGRYAVNPTTRYDLHSGEWRGDPPRVSYSADRDGLVRMLKQEQRASAWTEGASNHGPTITVKGRTLSCPPTSEDIEWLEHLASPAPFGRGEETLLDPKVRDTRQIEAEHLQLEGDGWERLEAAMRGAIATDMGLADTNVNLTLLKLLVYGEGGHFDTHADTEKTPGMVASAALVLPGEYTGGALVVEHEGKALRTGADGSAQWRWAAWYADCRHRLEPVKAGVRTAVTFAASIDAQGRLSPRKATNHRIGWALWGRSYAEWHTEWAARANRARAGNEQYGQKLVWVLSHRYTEASLRGCLLKGRDRELAEILLEDPHSEARYLGWLEIREVGPARTEEGVTWAEDEWDWDDAEDEPDDPPPKSLVGLDPFERWPDDPAPTRLKHRKTSTLHMERVTRQNAWIEGLRTLEGEPLEHGPIEVLDGEIAPEGAFKTESPVGARVYEDTGNEGASVEMQYRRAVLVLWRRNAATLGMLARSGGRLALATEVNERRTKCRNESEVRGHLEDALALWDAALACDGGGPAPEAHRKVLELIDGEEDPRHRDAYIEHVAAVDLDADAAPTIARWIAERIDANRPTQAWTRALEKAIAPGWPRGRTSGAPVLLRTLAANPKTLKVAVGLVGGRARRGSEYTGRHRRHRGETRHEARRRCVALQTQGGDDQGHMSTKTDITMDTKTLRKRYRAQLETMLAEVGGKTRKRTFTRMVRAARRSRSDAYRTPTGSLVGDRRDWVDARRNGARARRRSRVGSCSTIGVCGHTLWGVLLVHGVFSPVRHGDEDVEHVSECPDPPVDGSVELPVLVECDDFDGDSALEAPVVEFEHAESFAERWVCVPHADASDDVSGHRVEGVEAECGLDPCRESYASAVRGWCLERDRPIARGALDRRLSRIVASSLRFPGLFSSKDRHAGDLDRVRVDACDGEPAPGASRSRVDVPDVSPDGWFFHDGVSSQH